jgi:osmotically-inducible protein OsmY
LQLAIHGGFLVELAIWTTWQLFGHHTTLLPVYFAHPLYGPACLSVATVVSRHVGAVDRRVARVAVVVLPLACIIALVDSTRLLGAVRAHIGSPFAVSATLLLFYAALALVRPPRSQPPRRHAVLAGSSSVCAVVFLLPLTFASTAPDYLYAPTPCRLYPDFNRFIIESSQYLRRQTPHASSVFVWASPDDRMAVSPPCRPFWTGAVEEVADSFLKVSHTYLYDWKPHMTPAADVPLDRLRQIGSDPDSVVAVVSSDHTFADTMRARFESAGVTMNEAGQLHADTAAGLPSIFLLVPADARLATDIKRQLNADPTTASSDVDIDVRHGVARLSGLADSDAARQRAFALARAVKGVTDVTSDVRIRAEVIRDVKGALAADPLVGRIPIDVQSMHGTIALVGDKTNQQERTRALQVARAAAGVVPVEDCMK